MMSEEIFTAEMLGKPPLDAVVVYGHGPLELRKSIDPKKNPSSKNVYNFLGSIAAKLLVGGGKVGIAILSGNESAYKRGADATPVELSMSEAEMLGITYNRAKPFKALNRAQIETADKMYYLEPKAQTTFGNIIEAINLLDLQSSNGYWDGKLGIISPQWHGPRIEEMITAFGLRQARFIASDRVMRYYGYNNVRSDVKPFSDFENAAYPSQPAGLQNLQDNPGYVAFELANVVSDRRFVEMASSLKRYYAERNIPIRDEFQAIWAKIPDAYDPSTDPESLHQLRRELDNVKTKKHDFMGEIGAVDDYKRQAHIIGSYTGQILNGNI